VKVGPKLVFTVRRRGMEVRRMREMEENEKYGEE